MARGIDRGQEDNQDAFVEDDPLHDVIKDTPGPQDQPLRGYSATSY